MYIHRLFLDHIEKDQEKFKLSFELFYKILWKVEHLLQKSKCSFSHNNFKYMIFQRRQKALLWSKGLNILIFFPNKLLIVSQPEQHRCKYRCENWEGMPKFMHTSSMDYKGSSQL